MFVFGIVMALPGSILPALAGRLHFGLPDIGVLFLLMSAAMLAASLMLGLAMDRFGMKPVLVPGSMTVTLSLMLVAFLRRSPRFGPPWWCSESAAEP